MKKILKYILIVVVTATYGQELNLPTWTQYLADNEFVISPTFAGIGDNLRVRVNGLTQWVGIKNAPDNQSFYFDARISNRSGVGLSAYNDKNGNTRQTGVKFSFAHHIVLDYYTKQFLSFGISYNINAFKIDIHNFQPTPEMPIMDPGITDDRAITNHNFDVGFLYRFKDFYLSFNTNNILDKDINAFNGFEPNMIRNYQFYSGLVIRDKYNKDIEYEPSVFYQLYGGDGRSATDINFKYRKYTDGDDYYWIGGSYRFLNDQFGKPLNIGPMAGIMKSKIYFAYSYQITTNSLAGYNTGTHMVTIGWDFLQGISDCPCTKSKINKF